MNTPAVVIYKTIFKADPEITNHDFVIISLSSHYLIKFSKEYRKGTNIPVKVWPALRSIGGIACTRLGKIRNIKIYK